MSGIAKARSRTSFAHIGILLAFGIDQLVWLFATIPVEIEDENAFVICGPFEYFAVTKVRRASW